MIATDERYLQMQNGKLFSTGNHPVETLLTILHIHEVGFEIYVATLSDNASEHSNFPFAGYKLAVFLDALDEDASIDIGDIPGRLRG